VITPTKVPPRRGDRVSKGPVRWRIHTALHRMSLERIDDASSGADRLQRPHPEFRLRSDRQALPCGWVTAAYRWQNAGDPRGRLVLVAETAEAQSQNYLLPARDTTRTPVLIRLPGRVRDLRIRLPPASFGDPAPLQIKELSALQTLRRQLRPYATVVLREPAMAWHFFRRCIDVLLQHGVHELSAALTLSAGPRLPDAYAEWVRRYDAPGEPEACEVRRHLAQLRNRPTFTCIVPVTRHAAPETAAAIRSVHDQWYPHWELLLVTSSESVDAATATPQSSDENGRIRVLVAPNSGCPTDALNLALAQAAGTFCVVVTPEAQLAPYALYSVAVECNAHPDALVIYGDEDHVNRSGQRHTPMFKPDWNPDLLRSQPLIGSLIIYRTSLLRSLRGWRAGLDGLAGWDLALRASTAVSETRIRHVPHVLQHRRAESPAAPVRPAIEIVRRVLGDHLDRVGVTAAAIDDGPGSVRIRYSVGASPPLVSIIVPTRNGRRLLERCVTALRRTADTPFELLVVDNQSDDAETLAYLTELEAHSDVRLLRFDRPFNFSAVNNFAAAHAGGDILMLLNNDVEAIEPGWLSEMVGHALRPEVGAVGAKLYYPDGRIQHAGIVLGLGKLAGHGNRGLIEPDPMAGSRTDAVQNVSAVTAACLVIRAEVYHIVGGLDEALPIAYNDVDLCLRLRQRGYRIVWTPYAQLYHRESATRGLDHTMEKVRRLRREQRLMLQRWGATLNADPAYNPNLSLVSPGFTPAFPPRVPRPWSVRPD